MIKIAMTFAALFTLAPGVTVAQAARTHSPASTPPPASVVRPATPDLGHRIEIIDPKSVEPIRYATSPSMWDGRQDYRRPVTYDANGAVNLDIGIVKLKAGFHADKPYTYDRDEICYQVAGEAEWIIGGVVMTLVPGQAIWTPAGKPTESVKYLTDVTLICAFAPARRDALSHRVPTLPRGQWNAEPRARVQVIDWRYVGPTAPPTETDASGIVRRLIVSRMDGATTIDMTHTAYKAGTRLAGYSYDEDQICYVESGELELISGGAKLQAHAGLFIYRPANVASEATTITSDATTVCFFGPARKADAPQEGRGP